MIYILMIIIIIIATFRNKKRGSKDVLHRIVKEIKLYSRKREEKRKGQKFDTSKKWSSALSSYFPPFLCHVVEENQRKE